MSLMCSRLLPIIHSFVQSLEDGGSFCCSNFPKEIFLLSSFDVASQDLSKARNLMGRLKPFITTNSIACRIYDLFFKKISDKTECFSNETFLKIPYLTLDEEKNVQEILDQDGLVFRREQDRRVFWSIVAHLDLSSPSQQALTYLFSFVSGKVFCHPKIEEMFLEILNRFHLMDRQEFLIHSGIFLEREIMESLNAFSLASKTVGHFSAKELKSHLCFLYFQDGTLIRDYFFSFLMLIPKEFRTQTLQEDLAFFIHCTHKTRTLFREYQDLSNCSYEKLQQIWEVFRRFNLPRHLTLTRLSYGFIMGYLPQDKYDLSWIRSFGSILDCYAHLHPDELSTFFDQIPSCEKEERARYLCLLSGSVSLKENPTPYMHQIFGMSINELRKAFELFEPLQKEYAYSDYVLKVIVLSHEKKWDENYIEKFYQAFSDWDHSMDLDRIFDFFHQLSCESCWEFMTLAEYLFHTQKSFEVTIFILRTYAYLESSERKLENLNLLEELSFRCRTTSELDLIYDVLSLVPSRHILGYFPKISEFLKNNTTGERIDHVLYALSLKPDVAMSNEEIRSLVAFLKPFSSLNQLHSASLLLKEIPFPQREELINYCMTYVCDARQSYVLLLLWSYFQSDPNEKMKLILLSHRVFKQDLQIRSGDYVTGLFKEAHNEDPQKLLSLLEPIYPFLPTPQLRYEFYCHLLSLQDKKLRCFFVTILEGLSLQTLTNNELSIIKESIQAINPQYFSSFIYLWKYASHEWASFKNLKIVMSAFLSWDPEQVNKIIEAASLLDRQDRTLWTVFCFQSLGISSNTFLSLEVLFQQEPVVKLASYEYIKRSFIKYINDHSKMYHMSRAFLIYEQLYNFEDQEFLVQEAHARRIATSKNELSSIKNPYQIYKNLKKSLDEDPLYPVELTGLSGYVLDIENIRRHCFAYQFYVNEAPKVTFHQIIAGLKERLDQPQVMAAIEEAYPIPDPHSPEEMLRAPNVVAALEWNFLVDTTMTLSLEVVDVRKPVLPQTYYLHKILKFLYEQSDQPLEGALSPRETVFLNFSYVVMGCSTGQKDGISRFYRYLNKGVDPRQEKIEEKDLFLSISQAYQKTVEDFLSSSEFLQPYFLEAPLSQESHHLLYLKNRLSLQLGLKHSLTFDLHTHTLSDLLVSASTFEIIQAYCARFSLSSLVNKMSHHLHLVIQSQPQLSSLLSDLIPDHLSWSDEQKSLIISLEGYYSLLIYFGYLKKITT